MHTTARTCVSLYNSLIDANIVSDNQAEFRSIKEEIAIGLGRPFSEMGISYETRGLPAIITNLAVMNSKKPDDLIRWYIKFFDCRNRFERIEHSITPCVVKSQRYYPSDLYFAGIVISDGEADPMHGDTALTLMIGGKITILNGHFPMRVNDKVQWYFKEEYEAGMFDDDGLRVRRVAGTSDPVDLTRQPVSREVEKIRNFVYAERAAMKTVVTIKPCSRGLDGLGATEGDVARIIGICCSNANANERYPPLPALFCCSRLYLMLGMVVQGGYKNRAHVPMSRRMTSRTQKRQQTDATTTAWDGARQRWAGGALGPWERITAMLAAGQLMRMGLDASGVPALVFPRQRRVATAPPALSTGDLVHAVTALGMPDETPKHVSYFRSIEQLSAHQAPTLVPTEALLQLQRDLDAHVCPPDK